MDRGDRSMTNYDIVKEKTGGSPEGAAAFMIEVFILGFNLAVECMETGEMAPDAEVLARYFLWFLAKDPEETGEAQKDPEALKEAARTFLMQNQA